jgi:hypothetical protein
MWQMIPFQKTAVFRSFFWVYFSLLCLMTAFQPLANAEEILQGHLQQTAEPIADKLQGRIVDDQTGQPILDATVSIPDDGFSMQTNSQGVYQIPRYMGQHPLIMSIKKTGYAPFSMSIREQVPPYFEIRLQRQMRMIVLDDQLRHIGDGSFSTTSSNALEFRKPPVGPALRIPFNLQGVEISDAPILQIGSIIGLDTAMAHYLSGNHMTVYATPLLIKLNGQIIAKVDVNGDKKRIHIPKTLIKRQGTNLLEVEAGYHYLESGSIDYDDMELMHLVLYL